MSAAIVHLEENLGRGVFIDVLPLIWILAQMNFRCWVFLWLRCLVRKISDFISQ